jgi:hypothetical protein
VPQHFAAGVAILLRAKCGRQENAEPRNRTLENAVTAA